jgi:nicotinamidase-related amidase
MKIPVVVTTTTEKMWEPLILELAEALQSVPKIERTTVNAWTEKRVVDAVKSTGRKQLIVTGISTDVCLAFLAISALADGYGTFGVINASGAFTKMQGMLGMMRMMQAGVVPAAYSNVAVEIWPIMRHPRPKRYTVPSACHLSAWSMVSNSISPASKHSNLFG